MPQMQLPVFCDGVTAITNDVGYQKIENTVVYFYGTLPVFSHALEDLNSFRMIVSQLYVNGSVPQSVLAQAFQIKPLALKRWVKKYREEGPGSFFKSRKGGSRARVLTAEVLEKVIAGINSLELQLSELYFFQTPEFLMTDIKYAFPCLFLLFLSLLVLNPDERSNFLVA